MCARACRLRVRGARATANAIGRLPHMSWVRERVRARASKDIGGGGGSGGGGLTKNEANESARAHAAGANDDDERGGRERAANS